MSHNVSRLKRQPAKLAAVLHRVPMHKAIVTNGTTGTTRTRATRVTGIIGAGATDVTIAVTTTTSASPLMLSYWVPPLLPSGAPQVGGPSLTRSLVGIAGGEAGSARPRDWLRPWSGRVRLASSVVMPS